MDELTKNIKYVFLDVVKYTQRHVEAQIDIIQVLNEIVRDTFKTIAAKSKKHSDELLEIVDILLEGVGIKEVIYIPTGDGICIAMSGESKFDIHMIVALVILERIHHYNEKQKDEMRRFNVRIGINENVDNVIKDINGRRNVAGSGINLASRIMDNADGGQILVSQAVYDILHVREKYTDAFKSYFATIKHGIEIPVHQYIKDGHIGLDTKTPSSLSSKKTTYRLSKKSAYYFAHALKNRQFITKNLSVIGTGEYVSVILLWYLAEDSDALSRSKDFDIKLLKQPGKGELSIEEQYEALNSTLTTLINDLYQFIVYHHLDRYHRESFEIDYYGMRIYSVINKHGQEKLKKQHHEIWQEFNLDDYVEKDD